MERFLIREWAIILPGCDRTAALARGAILAARWLQEPQPISNHPVGLGFPHPAGRYRPGRPAFTSSVVRVVEIWKEFWSGDGNLSSPGAAGPRRWPERQLSPRAGSMSSSQSAITQWSWGFHTLQGGIDPGDLPVRPRLLEL